MAASSAFLPAAGAFQQQTVVVSGAGFVSQKCVHATFLCMTIVRGLLQSGPHGAFNVAPVPWYLPGCCRSEHLSDMGSQLQSGVATFGRHCTLCVATRKRTAINLEDASRQSGLIV